MGAALNSGQGGAMNVRVRSGAAKVVFAMVVGIAIILVVVLAFFAWPRHPKSGSGSELFAILPAVIETIQYESPTAKVTIARAPGTEAFVINTALNGSIERCTGSAAVSAALRSFASVRVVRNVDPPVTDDRRGSLDRLEISFSEPGSESEAWDVDSRLDDSRPVLVSNGKYAWEVDLSKSALRLLRGGCKALREAKN
jgi:hypothetical protein